MFKHCDLLFVRRALAILAWWLLGAAGCAAALFLVVGATNTYVSTRLANRAAKDTAIAETIARLRDGDRRAADFLATCGPAAFDCLVRELEHPQNGRSQVLALSAFCRLKDRRVFLVLVQGVRPVDYTDQWNREWTGYFLRVVRRPIDDPVYDDEQRLVLWYLANSARMMWDQELECYRVPDGPELP